jgi:hypothetical protein
LANFLLKQPAPVVIGLRFGGDDGGEHVATPLRRMFD